MAGNKALQRAAKAQQDEFYTSLYDIENEMYYYREHFKGKVVLCNCDDPYESAFFKYFAMKFNTFGLKKLIATCYAGSPIAQRQLSLFDEDTPPRERKPYCAVVEEFLDYNGDTATDLTDIRYILEHNVGGGVRVLEGDGDFRSPECVELLKEADIVATNPPFSLFREYVAQLFEYGKKFIIIGSQNALTYKEIFPLFMQNRMWMGVGFNGGNAYFEVPTDDTERYAEGVYDSEKNRVKFRNVRWFTNLEHGRRHEDVPLYETYTPEKYPKYDNYDAIEVSKTHMIPMDYWGVMGVPITFMDKYDPNQFEIVGCTESEGKGLSNGLWDSESKVAQPLINGRRIYKRLFIRRRT